MKFNFDIDFADFSGVIVSNWNPDTSKSFPDELGEYAQGDILFPPETKRNGLIAESTRWPNRIIPYVIEGNFRTYIFYIFSKQNRIHAYKLLSVTKSQLHR